MDDVREGQTRGGDAAASQVHLLPTRTVGFWENTCPSRIYLTVKVEDAKMVRVLQQVLKEE